MVQNIKKNILIIYETKLFNVKIKELCRKHLKRPSKSVDTRLINKNTLKYDLKFITVCNNISHTYLSVNYKKRRHHLSQ